MEKIAKPSILLHSCCGPCSTTGIERLMTEYSVTVLYYNPCIHPLSEYEKRKQTQIDLIEKLNSNLEEKVYFLESDYDDKKYFEKVKGHEKDKEGGERCKLCFIQRLEMTAKLAKEKGFDFFTTTLTVSPHKNAELINKIGEELALKYDVKYLPCNFKKQNGYLRSVELSKAYGLYRQNYCGCVYSMRGESHE